MKKNKKSITEKSLKKIYEKCKPGMQSRLGRVLTYEEFCNTLAYAHAQGMDSKV